MTTAEHGIRVLANDNVLGEDLGLAVDKELDFAIGLPIGVELDAF